MCRTIDPMRQNLSAESNAMPQEASAALDPRAPTLDQLADEALDRDEEPKVGELRDVVTAETSAQAYPQQRTIFQTFYAGILTASLKPASSACCSSLGGNRVTGLAAQHVWSARRTSCGSTRSGPCTWTSLSSLMSLPRSDDRNNWYGSTSQYSPDLRRGHQATAVMQNRIGRPDLSANPL